MPPCEEEEDVDGAAEMGYGPERRAARLHASFWMVGDPSGTGTS